MQTLPGEGQEGAPCDERQGEGLMEHLIEIRSGGA